MTLPNFVVIGAGKAGTTALYQWLRQHPDVYCPASIKETFFLLYNPDDPTHVADAGTRFPITTLEDYEALFEGATTEKAVGEATPAYLDSPFAPRKMKALIPDARLIVSLRDPVTRVYSHAQMNVRHGYATDVAAEARRLATTDEHVYAPKLARYLDHFPREQLCVLLYEELDDDPDGALSTVLRFLDVDDSFRPDLSVRYNPGGVPRSRVAQRLLEMRALRALRPIAPQAAFDLVARLRKANARPAQPLTDELRAELRARYHDDVQATEALVDRDLTSFWGQ